MTLRLKIPDCESFYADWLANCTTVDLPVSGSFIARAIYRKTAAAEAAAIALYDIAMIRKEQLVDRGLHRRDIIIRRLKDSADGT